jgi:NADPH:quinone reductase-like Zn-dependent oxidoreductase
MAGSGLERALCRNRYPLLSARICPVKSSRSGRGAELLVGDQVYGVTNPQFVGSYVKYALASAGMVSSKPTSLTHVEAASVPVVAVTAWQALFDHAQLKAGRTVVILGASGNVGSYAVQLARQAGVKTIATISTGDISAVRNLAQTP